MDAPKRKLPHREKAKQQGVSPKTIDRWVEDGILPPPDYVNGRKYHDEDSQPRTSAPPDRLPPERTAPTSTTAQRAT